MYFHDMTVANSFRFPSIVTMFSVKKMSLVYTITADNFGTLAGILCKALKNQKVPFTVDTNCIFLTENYFDL